MKKLAIQMSLFFGFIIAAAISGQAQVVERYKAQMPFDFAVGSRAYEAGNYNLRVERHQGYAVLSLEDAKCRVLQTILAVNGGQRSRSEETTLGFRRFEEGYYLSEIVSPEIGVALLAPTLKGRLAKQRNVRSVAVALTGDSAESR